VFALVITVIASVVVFLALRAIPAADRPNLQPPPSSSSSGVAGLP
jgi:hypothetical protein